MAAKKVTPKKRVFHPSKIRIGEINNFFTISKDVARCYDAKLEKVCEPCEMVSLGFIELDILMLNKYNVEIYKKTKEWKTENRSQMIRD